MDLEGACEALTQVSAKHRDVKALLDAYLATGNPHTENLNTAQSPTVFAIPGLRASPVWSGLDAVTEELLSSVDAIREEFKNVLNSQGLSVSDKITSSVRSGSWNVFYLVEEGLWNETLCDLCPLTQSLISKLPLVLCSMGYAYFSVITPGTVIKPHYGSTNAKLRIQLPLEGHKDCNLIVNNETYNYEAGKCLVFDDSYLHEVIHASTTESRIVLVLDIWHPDLTTDDISHICSVFCPRKLIPFSCTGGNMTVRVDAAGMVADYDFLYKTLSIGATGVGKSSFLLRFADDTYIDSFISTIGVDFKIRTIQMDGKIIKLQMWDVAGPERFRTITSSYYKGAHGIFIMYGVDSRADFDSVTNWFDEIKKYNNQANVMLVATKSDISDRAVSFEEGQSKADQLGIPFIECSSKNSINVTETVMQLVGDIKRRCDLLPAVSPEAVSISNSRDGGSSNQAKKCF